MNELRKQWVDALRSGKYEQGQGGCLRTVDNKYCSLGVACDVAGVDWRVSPMIMDGPERYGIPVHDSDYFLNCSKIPYSVSKALGILNIDELVDMNDKQGKTFSEIADYIESLPEVASV